jgi:ATP-dependent protease ClpP protease subunit
MTAPEAKEYGLVDHVIEFKKRDGTTEKQD